MSRRQAGPYTHLPGVPRAYGALRPDGTVLESRLSVTWPRFYRPRRRDSGLVRPGQRVAHRDRRLTNVERSHKVHTKVSIALAATVASLLGIPAASAQADHSNKE